jgi:hypothetical protein
MQEGCFCKTFIMLSFGNGYLSGAASRIRKKLLQKGRILMEKVMK